ncbi:DUF4767 domain-containing protein [Vagococcus teuberi]|uniref:DUF4767 domain-containing protein n=1 Tax=Vagococcus teuberi TaxID=519472 RepID=A0A1J0A415_9ENTE|nr:DUF4767 domain-containing protein [Vagococcus teuberi]APB30685.1 hypothetical protein BHY08_01885 [Vagococcus teuberi]
MTKRLRSFIVLGLALVVMTACGNSDTFDQSMQKTKEAIIEKKFEQAEGFVEMALESKPKDDEAKNYQTQLKHYNKALEYKEAKDKEKALSELDSVIKIKKGSDKLVEYAKKEKEKLEATKTSESKETDKTEESSNKKDETTNSLWNDAKKDSLRGFMSQFSNKMGQNYKEYNQSNSVDLYGLKVPGDIFNGTWTMAINNQPVQVEWSETGEGSAPYQLVAVYSDADTQPYLQKHVYFFIIENGQPKVYVTQQNQGNNENYLHFSETQNPDIKAGFSQIVGGDVAQSTKSTSTSYENNKLLAAKVLIKMASLSESRVNELLNSTTTYSLYPNKSLQIWETGVYLPEDVTVISGNPLSAGMFTYHNNGDGTVTSYPVPSHYQDKEWDDPVKGKELANKVISDASVINIKDVSDDLANKLIPIIENDV